jgi:ribosomal protein L20A (L18A)
MKKSKIQNILTKEILECEYKELGSMQKIANKLNVSIDSVYKYMKLYHIEYKKHYTGIYNCNENFFKEETPESFYVAGFLAADGSLQQRKYSKIVKICLSKKDKQHLEKIKSILKSNHPIKEYQVKPTKKSKISGYCVEIQIVSNTLFDDLARFNIIPKKTFVYCIPEWIINHQLVNHFMRGYFDGDGCVSWCGLGDGRTIRQLYFNILGTKLFLEAYQNILEHNCQLNHNNLCQKDNVFSLSYSGNNIIQRIGNFLYKDATIYLERKYDQINLLLKHHNYQKALAQ